jgi:hypothetical protein
LEPLSKGLETADLDIIQFDEPALIAFHDEVQDGP